MTDQEIIEWLAEFMGWQFTDDKQIIGLYSFEGITGTVWFRRANDTIGVTGAITYHDFNPLNDPAACALVKAELRRRKWWYRLTNTNHPIEPIEFRVIPKRSVIGHTYADTEERAVCLAVLEVLAFIQQ